MAVKCLFNVPFGTIKCRFGRLNQCYLSYIGKEAALFKRFQEAQRSNSLAASPVNNMNTHSQILIRKVLGRDVALDLVHLSIPAEICSKLIFSLKDIFPVIQGLL